MDADEENAVAARIKVAVLGHPCVDGKAGTHTHPGPDEIEDIEDTVGNVEEQPVTEAFSGSPWRGCLLGKCGDRDQEENQHDDRRQ
jgi:hypothetical protein